MVLLFRCVYAKLFNILPSNPFGNLLQLGCHTVNKPSVCTIPVNADGTKHY
jgi:hypothetical protein